MMPKLEKILSNWAVDGAQESVCRIILDNAGSRFTSFHHAQGLILEADAKNPGRKGPSLTRKRSNVGSNSG